MSPIHSVIQKKLYLLILFINKKNYTRKGDHFDHFYRNVNCNSVTIELEQTIVSRT